MNESGIINLDTYGEIFRGLSQRRKHGTLEVTIEKTTTCIRFLSGKITEVRDGEVPMAHSVAQMLVAASVLPEIPDGRTFQSFEELQNYLSEKKINFDVDALRNAAKHFMLDSLYSLDLEKGGYFSFRTEMVNSEKDYIPTISVGQFLLDVVAIQTDKDKFIGLFPPRCLVRLTGKDSPMLTSDELTIISALTDGPQERDKLKALSLLSEYTFQETLTTLQTEGIIEAALNTSESTSIPKQPVPKETGAKKGDSDDFDDDMGDPFDEEDEDGSDLTLGEVEEDTFSDDLPEPDLGEEDDDDDIILEVEGAWKDDKVAPGKRTARSKLRLSTRISGWIRSSGERFSHTKWATHAIALAILAGAWLLPLLLWGETFRLFTNL